MTKNMALRAVRNLAGFERWIAIGWPSSHSLPLKLSTLTWRRTSKPHVTCSAPAHSPDTASTVPLRLDKKPCDRQLVGEFQDATKGQHVRSHRPAYGPRSSSIPLTPCYAAHQVVAVLSPRSGHPVPVWHERRSFASAGSSTIRACLTCH